MMSRLMFTVVNESCAWLVKGNHVMGPFNSKEDAVSLAQGMAAALRLHGEPCDVVIDPERRSFNPDPPILRSRPSQ